MFDQLAPSYDLMNRVMTLGQDQRWRRFVVDQLDLGDGARVLDLACGTGDIAFEMIRRCPSAQVVAADFSQEMLLQGQKRPASDLIRWVACDAMELPFADNCFDAVTFGYLLRNVEQIDVALNEVRRVLKPGGRVVCLDTMPPPPSFLAPFLRAYLSWGLPMLGRFLAGNSAAYAYLCSSTLAFQDPEALKGFFQRAGFLEVSFRTFMFQTVAVHLAFNPARSGRSNN